MIKFAFSIYFCVLNQMLALEYFPEWVIPMRIIFVVARVTLCTIPQRYLKLAMKNELTLGFSLLGGAVCSGNLHN